MTYEVKEGMHFSPSETYRGYVVIDSWSRDAVSRIFRTKQEALKYIQQLYKQGEENEV